MVFFLFCYLARSFRVSATPPAGGARQIFLFVFSFYFSLSVSICFVLSDAEGRGIVVERKTETADRVVRYQAD